MKRRTILILFSAFICICICCCGKKENYISGTEAAVSGGVTGSSMTVRKSVSSGAIISNKAKPRMIIDNKGKKRKLNIGNVDTENGETPLRLYNSASDYRQVVEDHYYYLRKGHDGYYTLYQDKGREQGSFKVDEGHSFAGCALYKDKFYVMLDDDNDDGNTQDIYDGIEEGMGKLAVVDFTEKKLNIIGNIPQNPNMCFYQDKIFFFTLADPAVLIMDMKGTVQKVISNPEKKAGDKDILVYEVMDGKIYYKRMRKGKETWFCRLNLETGEDEEVFRYKPGVGKSVKGLDEVYMDITKEGLEFTEEYETGDMMYSIQWGKKRMQKGSAKRVSFYLSGNDQYILYLDRFSKLYKCDRKTRKGTIIQDLSSIEDESYFTCTNQGVYIQETIGEHRLFYQDLSGKKTETIWDEKYIEEDWEDEICGSS